MKNTIFAETLTTNLTIKNHKNALLNGEAIGAENFAKWQFTLKCAYEAFYRYQSECFNLAKMGENSVPDATNAFKELQAILDLVGEVNGHKIPKSMQLLNAISVHAIKTKEVYVGKAGLVKSQLDNYKREYRNIPNGASDAYIEGLEKNISEKEEELRMLCTTVDSAGKSKTRTTWSAFRYNVETTLAQVISDQQAKSWDELEAEAEAKRKERRAKTKAKKAEAKAK